MKNVGKHHTEIKMINEIRESIEQFIHNPKEEYFNNINHLTREFCEIH